MCASQQNNLFFIDAVSLEDLINMSPLPRAVLDPLCDLCTYVSLIVKLLNFETHLTQARRVIVRKALVIFEKLTVITICNAVLV